MAIEVSNAGASVETLTCDRCHESAEMKRADPQRPGWIVRHLRCGEVPVEDPT